MVLRTGWIFTGGLIAYEIAKQLKEMGKQVWCWPVVYCCPAIRFITILGKRIPARIKTFFKKIWCTMVLMKEYPWFILHYRMMSLWKKTISRWNQLMFWEKTRMIFMFIRQNNQKPDDSFPDYRLVLRWKIIYSGKEKSYYLQDFKFLVWRCYALHGVMFMMSGHHTEMFKPARIRKELAKVCKLAWTMQINPKRKLIWLPQFIKSRVKHFLPSIFLNSFLEICWWRKAI